MKRIKKKILLFLGLVVIGYLLFNSLKIYFFSNEYYETNSDVGIVLGAGTNNGKISPVFRERINHSIYLYKKGIIRKLIFTGGFGEGQTISDSQAAKSYALSNGVQLEDIIIEEKSKYTFENLVESKHIMDSLNLKSALIISDPLHMKRSMKMAEKQNIKAKPSPTKTSMYKSTVPKLELLAYETFYYTLGEIFKY